MSAAGIQVVTLAFPNPDVQSIRSTDFNQVDTRLSYTFRQETSIRTLSTHGASTGHDIDGILYYPTLPQGVCTEAAALVPNNVTTAADLPQDRDIFWVALAPWINVNCTVEYLAATHATPTQAFLFYLPDNSTREPPETASSVWDLGDGGHWKSVYDFPVYVIPATAGQSILQALAYYSGNVTEVPNGNVLATEYPVGHYIRLAAEIDIDGHTTLPSLWVFLLIVLGILIMIIASTSCSMQFVQRRRRDRLQRRVANGEVDLEALGIKRLTVPQEVIDKMILYTYTDNEPVQVEEKTAQSDTAEVTSHPESSSADAPKVPMVATASTNRVTEYSQVTCPICLEDYVSGETMVRELPCKHIFHPECLDSFLRQNSSLCPICKKTVLPPGYCPATITNAMVRRERMVRRIRERVRTANGEALPESGELSLPRMRDAVRSAMSSSGRHIFSQPYRPQPRSRNSIFSSLELRPRTNASSEIETVTDTRTGAELCEVAPSSDPPPAGVGRREWARQRALAMLDPRREAQDREIEAEAARTPAWRRVVGKIFPAFG